MVSDGECDLSGHGGFVLDGGQTAEAGLASAAAVGPFIAAADAAIERELLIENPLSGPDSAACRRVDRMSVVPNTLTS